MNKETSLEAEFGYRRQELNAVSAHLSLVRDLPSVGRIKPYLAAGIGLEEYGAPLPQPNGTVATLGRMALSVNAGDARSYPWSFQPEVTHTTLFTPSPGAARFDSTRAPLSGGTPQGWAQAWLERSRIPLSSWSGRGLSSTLSSKSNSELSQRTMV